MNYTSQVAVGDSALGEEKVGTCCFRGHCRKELGHVVGELHCCFLGMT